MKDLEQIREEFLASDLVTDQETLINNISNWVSIKYWGEDILISFIESEKGAMFDNVSYKFDEVIAIENKGEGSQLIVSQFKLIEPRLKFRKTKRGIYYAVVKEVKKPANRLQRLAALLAIAFFIISSVNGFYYNHDFDFMRWPKSEYSMFVLSVIALCLTSLSYLFGILNINENEK